MVDDQLRPIAIDASKYPPPSCYRWAWGAQGMAGDGRYGAAHNNAVHGVDDQLHQPMRMG